MKQIEYATHLTTIFVVSISTKKTNPLTKINFPKVFKLLLSLYLCVDTVNIDVRMKLLKVTFTFVVIFTYLNTTTI